MTLPPHLEPLRLYTPAEAAHILGSAVTVSWLKDQVRKRPELGTRHTGRRRILFTAEQVVRLRAVLSEPAGQSTDVVDPTAAGGWTTAGPSAVELSVSRGDAPAPPPSVAPRPFRSLREPAKGPSATA